MTTFWKNIHLEKFQSYHADDEIGDDDGDFNNDGVVIMLISINAGGGFVENELDPPLKEECFVDLPSCQVRSLHTSGFLCTQSGTK